MPGRPRGKNSRNLPRAPSNTDNIPQGDNQALSAPLQNEPSNVATDISNLVSLIQQQNEAQLSILREVKDTMSKVATKLDEQTEEYTESSESEHEGITPPSGVETIMASMNDDTVEMDHDDSFMSILSQNNLETAYGSEILPAIRDSIVNFNNLQLSKETLESLKDKYKIPTNCRPIGPPKVNPEIWSALSAAVQHTDLGYQTTQAHLTRSVVATGRLMESVLQLANKIPKDVVEIILRHAMDNYNSVVAANREINLKRRACIKPHLNTEYSLLCSPQIPVTELLFGENLETQMKSMKSVSKAVKLSKPRFSPYDAARRFGGQNRSFRGKRLNFQGRSRQSGTTRYYPREKTHYKKPRKEEKQTQETAQ